ncbi:MAG: endonuclease III [Planctomycetota bacterium]|nr:MAG: endonuclease III [Planctomycetota bacterium]
MAGRVRTFVTRKSALGNSKQNSEANDAQELLAIRKKRAKAVITDLKKLFPVAECALNHSSAFQLLVATILSAQCTDERVNQSTPELFRLYPDAASLGAATQEDVERIVKPLGFFRNKAANIRGMAQELTNRFGGEIPQNIEDLISLPGVGRKTASVVLGTWFGIPSGVVVDTHVKRLTFLLGLTTSENPEIIERDLIAILPQAEWIEFSHRLIHHGRRTCIARRPKCTECGLLKHCPRNGLSPLDGV